MTTHSNSGSRRWSRGAQLAVWGCALFLVAALVPGCGLDSPTSPNSPGDLQGNTSNQWSDFQGSIQIVVPTTDLLADDTTALTITAVVTTDAGQPATNLTPVTFSTNLGTFGDPSAAAAVTAATVTSFGGTAAVDLRSFQRAFGKATVHASVGNVSARVKLDLEHAEVKGSLSLVFRVQGQVSTNLAGPASAANPFYAGLVGTAIDEGGNPLRGVLIEFRITRDGTLGSGVGGARLDGAAVSYTDNTGEAINQLEVVGIGQVVLEADLKDPVSGAVVATSNQIILTTTETIFLQLTYDDGSTAKTGNGTRQMVATATDAAGDPFEGVFIRFEIQNDATDGASVSPASAVTDATGVATSTLNIPVNAILVGGEITTVVAKVVDSSGDELATSNTITNTYQFP